MKLLVALVLVPCFCLSIDGKGFLAEEDLVTNNDDPKFLNFYEEEPESFVNGIEDFLPQRYLEDQFSGESSGSKMLCFNFFFFNSAIFSSLQYICPIFGEFAGNTSLQSFDNFPFYAELVPLEKKFCSEIKLTWNTSERVD